MNLSEPVSALVPSLQGRIFVALARTTGGLTGASVARVIMDASYAGVQAALKKMVADGTVTRRQTGGSFVYDMNREHILWPAIENMVGESNEVMRRLESRIAHIVQKRLGFPVSEKVTLAFYGSVARGTSTSDSDIDIVAVFPAEAADDEVDTIIDELTTSVPRWTGNDCNIYSLAADEAEALTERGDAILQSWMADARTFNGPELRRVLGLTSDRPQRG